LVIREVQGSGICEFNNFSCIILYYRDIIFTKWQLHHLTNKLDDKTDLLPAINNNGRSTKQQKKSNGASLSSFNQQCKWNRREMILDLKRLYFVPPNEDNTYNFEL